jgi:starch synthase (maltosyl-transferring)
MQVVLDSIGLPAASIDALGGAGFDAALSSLAWWDGSAGWYYEEDARLRRCAVRVLARVDRGTADEVAGGAGELPSLALLADGLVAALPEAHAGARLAALAEANRLLAEHATPATARRPLLRGRRDGVVAVVIEHEAAPVSSGELLLANLGQGLAQVPLGELAREGGCVPPLPADAEGDCDAVAITLEPGALHLLPLEPPPSVRTPHARVPQRSAAEAARVAIEHVSPVLDGGRFAVRRCVGDRVAVEADIFTDGHERLAAVVAWRALDQREWQCAPMRHLGNDRWAATICVHREGRHEFVVEAWRDDFATLRDEVEKKLRAGVLLPVDLADARRLLDEVRARSRTSGDALDGVLAAWDAAADDAARAAVLLGVAAADAMAASGERPFLARSPAFPLEAERLQARYGSWYELFPRSSPDAGRHGTFDDVIAELPAIRAMGFDVLYMPPIHPIGRSNRKGRNNALVAAPGDPGSPYAIGSAEGGHDAVHPELGGMAAFRRLVAAARREGMEVALDFAVQASPDHPWLTQHPEWFTTRADGSIRHAENPPKKYEDIVNVDFYASGAVPSLWTALRDVVLHWAGEGVRLFRVDNPHTKPFPFWEWMIASVRHRHPDVLFLSEAFTRPKPMVRLAKVGFSQSYTYFTWRSGKQELTGYLEELNRGEARECLRPHFFVNTPDINPPYLHSGSRAAHLVRAALAATLSGLWGMYAGFELCEATPLAGREEYLDSEKYQLRARRRRAPGDIVEDIALLNRLRRANPELQTHLDITFLPASGEQVLYFAKGPPDADSAVLVAISLAASDVQRSTIEVPLWRWGLADDAAIEVEDLVGGQRFHWHGKQQTIELGPERPYALWRVFAPGAGNGGRA